MNRSTQLCTEAWLLRGISSIPGALKLADGHLSFTAFGSGNFWGSQLRKLELDAGRVGLAKQLGNDKDAVVFDIPLSEVQDVDFPWYYFSGGVKLTVNGVCYRFGFDRPENTRMPEDRENPIEVIATGVERVGEISKARRSGKAWKAVLIEQSK